ncbi:unnamed protein product [Calypogeia fissa]
MGSPKGPQVVKPYSRTFSFYVTLGSLSALLWVLASITNGSGLPSCPKFVTFREMRNIAASYNTYTPFKPKPSREQPLSFQSAQDLIDAIKAVTARAQASGPAIVFGEEEEQQWHRENPCRSRAELPHKYASRKIAQDVAPNAVWETVFAEYMKMHRTCMSRVGNVEDYFLSKNTSTGCKFLVTESPKVGLGNKVLFKASALLVAVLTQRVLLIPDKLNISELFCEPFVGSSWRLDTTSEIRTKHSSWHTTSDFQLWVDKTEYMNHTNPEEDLHAVDLSRYYQPLFRYYCNTEQAYISKVPWISIGGCLYILPKLFAIPAFRPALEEMFPDRMALTHILRSAFLPSDPIWERVDNVNDLYLRHTRSLIGVQLRYFDHKPQYRKMNDLINKRVLQCVIKEDLLPAALPLGDFPVNRFSDHHQRNTSKVFIASLFPGLHDYLSDIYVRRMTVSGDGVGVVQLTHESEQHFGIEVDVEAFVEIMCLSLSDALFVTPVSTFGGLAEAYGALKPWFINFDHEEGPACERAQSIDVCFDQASERFICPHDPGFHGRSVVDSVPYIQKCMKRDAPGVQLITQHESNPSSVRPVDENFLVFR